RDRRRATLALPRGEPVQQRAFCFREEHRAILEVTGDRQQPDASGPPSKLLRKRDAVSNGALTHAAHCPRRGTTLVRGSRASIDPALCHELGCRCVTDSPALWRHRRPPTSAAKFEAIARVRGVGGSV